MNRVLEKSETFISGELIISDRISLFTPTRFYCIAKPDIEFLIRLAPT